MNFLPIAKIGDPVEHRTLNYYAVVKDYNASLNQYLLTRCDGTNQDTVWVDGSFLQPTKNDFIAAGYRAGDWAKVNKTKFDLWKSGGYKGLNSRRIQLNHITQFVAYFKPHNETTPRGFCIEDHISDIVDIIPHSIDKEAKYHIIENISEYHIIENISEIEPCSAPKQFKIGDLVRHNSLQGKIFRQVNDLEYEVLFENGVNQTIEDIDLEAYEPESPDMKIDDIVKVRRDFSIQNNTPQFNKIVGTVTFQGIQKFVISPQKLVPIKSDRTVSLQALKNADAQLAEGLDPQDSFVLVSASDIDYKCLNRFEEYDIKIDDWVNVNGDLKQVLFFTHYNPQDTNWDGVVWAEGNTVLINNLDSKHPYEYYESSKKNITPGITQLGKVSSLKRVNFNVYLKEKFNIAVGDYYNGQRITNIDRQGRIWFNANKSILFKVLNKDLCHQKGLYQFQQSAQRILAKKITQAIHQTILKTLTNKQSIENIDSFLAGEVGRSLLAWSMGMALSQTKEPRLQMIAEELRIQGLADGADQILKTMVEQLQPEMLRISTELDNDFVEELEDEIQEGSKNEMFV
jgi:hypothetical protein